ncbi:MAG: hypothetical protein ABFC87_04710, partial [Fervidobacterium sp.]
MRKTVYVFLGILLVFATLALAQSPNSTPLEKLYYELKGLLESPDIDLQVALQEILQKYAPIVEPILPPGEYEEYSL